MATPALYQHIIVDQCQAVNLFRLFGSFPRSDNTIFLNPAPPNPSAHLIDIHIAERLQFFFSNTQSLSFKTTRCSDRIDYPDTKERLARYKELQIGLLTFNGPALWPKLERCAWFPRQSPAHPDNGTSLNTEEDEVFLESIFARLHPNQLVIQIPKLSPPFKRILHDLRSSAKHLRADHISFFDFSACAWGSIPHASESMTIHFRNWTTAETHHWNIDTLFELYRACLSTPFEPLDVFADISELRLVGVPPVDGYPSTRTKIVEDITSSVVDEIMVLRLKNGNLNDLKLKLKSDFSPEGEASAVSRVFKQPGRP